MYEMFFALHSRPFAPAPRSECYFPTATIEAALQTLSRCIERAEGAGMVVGPSGTGKTLLCQVLAERFRQQFEVVILSNGRVGSRRALLQGILHGLGQPYRDMDEGELRIALADYLCGPRASPRALLLFADEAHTLPLRCLDELRMVTNLAVQGQPRTRLVLAGAALLEERLAHPKLDSFSQRIAARCYLEAMTRTETESYIRAQIAAAGGNGAELFPSETCTAAFHATGGVPRLVNQVCDHALVLAFTAGQRRIDPGRIQEAWADLQQLPSPWNSEPGRQQPAPAVLEFGSLDDSAEGSVRPNTATPDSVAAEQAVSAACPAPADDLSSHPCDDPSPEQPLEKIEAMLGELEETFRPAGSIRPEVEIVLDDPDNPFSEPFLEEEIVVDRCAAALAQRNSAAVAAVPWAKDAPYSREAMPSDRGMVDRAISREGGDALETLDCAMPLVAECETLPLRSTVDTAESELEEPEVVIDETYDFVEPVQSHPVTPVRPQQYRNLFAQLRRA